MDDNDNMKYGIEFDAQIGKGFSSTIGKVKREIGKVPEERTLRFSAKANFKHLDKDMKDSLKTFEHLQKKMTGKGLLGTTNPIKGLANYVFGDRNRFKQLDKAFEHTKLRAIQARQEQYKTLKNLMGTKDIDDNKFSDESLMGQTNKAYAEQTQAVNDLNTQLEELRKQKEELSQQKLEMKMLPNEEKVVAQINTVMTAMDKLRAKIERYKKVDISGEQAQKQITDTSNRIYSKTEQLTRVAIGHFNNTGTDKMYRELRKTITESMKDQLAQLDDVKNQLEFSQQQYAGYLDTIGELKDIRDTKVRDLTAEELIELKGAEKAVETLDDKIRELSTRKNKIEIYTDVNKKQLDKMTALWKKRAEINTADGKSYNRNNAENYFAGGKNTLMNLQDTLSNKVTGTVSSGYIKDLEDQLESARKKKLELDDTLRNVVPMNESNIQDVEQKIADTEKKMKDVEKNIKLANGTSAELEKRWKLLNGELAELRNQWQLLNEDMQANPTKENFRSDAMQKENGLWDQINSKATKFWQIFKRNNAITRLGKRILTQIRNTIANMINPLNLFRKGWNDWLDRVENKQLKNTFEMIKYNLVTAFEPLFEKFAQFLLKVAQVANIFTKKFAGVDLFDSKDWKKNKAMLDQITASFDELHNVGENTDTIFDSGNFKMEPLSAEQVKFWEDMADKVKKAWEGVKKVFQWIIDHWKWLVAAWAGYKLAKFFGDLLGWGKNFSGLLKGLSLGSLLSSLAIAIGAATTLYGIFQDIKLAQKWNQMTPEERAKTANKGDAAMGIGGGLMGAGAGWKLGSSALGMSLGLTPAAGMVAGATFAGGIALGISGTANAITAATNGDYKMVQKESTKAGTGIGMAAGTAVGIGMAAAGTKIGVALGAWAGPVGAAIGAVVGAGVGFLVGKAVTFFGDMGGEFSKLKISTEDLQWATEQYNTALGNEYTALQDLKGMEEATGQSGEALYKAVENGSIKYSELTTEQKILLKAYENYQQCLEDTAAALKQQTDYENAILKDKAKESGDYSEFIAAMLSANKKGIYSAEETQDRLSQVYATLSKDEREVFLKKLPEDMKQGVEDGAYQYYSSWEKFKIGVGETWNAFTEGWSNFWGGVGTKLSEIWGGITTTAGNIWEGMKTTAGNIWNSIKIEATSAWDAIKESAIGQKVAEIATNVGEKWNEIKTKAGEVWEGIKTTVGEKVETLKTNLGAAWENVKTKAGEIWGGIKDKAGEIWGNIKETVGGKVEELKTKVKEKWDYIKDKAGETWDKIKTKASETWNNIKNSAIGQKVSEIATNVKNKFDEVKTNLTNAWNTLKTNASTAWNNIKNSIVNGAKSAWEGAKGFFQNIADGVKKAWDGVKDFASKTGQRFGNFFNGKGFKTDEEYAEFQKKHPSYDVGTNYVPNDQLAYVHKGEAIIPAKYNKPVSLDNTATNRTNEEIRNLVNQVRELQSMVAQGIRINGEFVQRGTDLVATVERASNKVSNGILSQKQYAR